jgi:hypothetical protein
MSNRRTRNVEQKKFLKNIEQGTKNDEPQKEWGIRNDEL